MDLSDRGSTIDSQEYTWNSVNKENDISEPSCSLQESKPNDQYNVNSEDILRTILLRNIVYSKLTAGLRQHASNISAFSNKYDLLDCENNSLQLDNEEKAIDVSSLNDSEFKTPESILESKQELHTEINKEAEEDFERKSFTSENVSSGAKDKNDSYSNMNNSSEQVFHENLSKQWMSQFYQSLFLNVCNVAISENANKSNETLIKDMQSDAAAADKGLNTLDNKDASQTSVSYMGTPFLKALSLMSSNAYRETNASVNQSEKSSYPQHPLLSIKPPGSLNQGSTSTTANGNEKLFYCDHCTKVFPTKVKLTNHMVTHSSLKPFHCSECGASFKTKSYLKKHMVAHSDEKRFQCPECNKQCKRKCDLNHHMLTHGSYRPFQCVICKKEFKSKGYLNYHILTHTNLKLFQCSECLKSFKFKGDFKKHMATHEPDKSYQCVECFKGFQSKVLLNHHMLSHSDVRPFECNICNSRFKTKGYLNKHMICHSDIKPFQCPRCEVNCKRKGDLKQHILRCHPDYNLEVEGDDFKQTTVKDYENELNHSLFPEFINVDQFNVPNFEDLARGNTANLTSGDFNGVAMDNKYNEASLANHDHSNMTNIKIEPSCSEESMNSSANDISMDEGSCNQNNFNSISSQDNYNDIVLCNIKSEIACSEDSEQEL